MQIPLRKSFRLLKFLNGDHPFFVRFCFATIGFCIALVATGQRSLASEIYEQYFTKRNFKLGSRRLAWFTQKSWLNLKISKEGIFDFTDDCNENQITALSSFTASSFYKENDLTEKAVDLAFISARNLDLRSSSSTGKVELADFKVKCQKILDCLIHIQPETSLSQTKTTRHGDFPVSDAINALSEFADLFPNNIHPWFLVSGTFLGLIRENGFLAHDYDIDLGIHEEQFDLTHFLDTIATSDKFVLKKFDYHKTSFLAPPQNTKNEPAPYIIKIDHISGLHIDLFIHYTQTREDGLICWHGTSLHRWNNSAFGLKTYGFYHMNVLGPDDANRYLTENYGDWETPVTDFNCTTDTPNLDIVNHPISIVIFLAKLAQSSKADSHAAEQLRHTLKQCGYIKQTAEGSCRAVFQLPD